MCGISVIINKKGKEITRNQIQTLNEPITHRGPDGAGIFLNQNVGLGHRRLSIIDTDQHSNQPLHKGDHAIVFNGEIYNYIEIRDELISKNARFSTNSDTEVLLQAFLVWGKSFVHKLRGMWSFCIYNKKANTLFLCRDRFGIKPLYYYEDRNEHIFVSEIKQIIKYKGRLEPSLETITAFLQLGLVEFSQNTFFEKVKKILPGHYLEIDCNNNGISTTQFYNLNRFELDKQRKLDIDEFEEKFQHTCQLHLRSDVPVANLCSGGIDSSLTSLYTIKDYGDNKLNLITLITNEAETDESYFAKKIASKYSCNWIPVEINKTNLFDKIDKIAWQIEEPFLTESTIVQYEIYNAARENSFKVVIDGQGADEILLGYERYLYITQNESFMKMILNGGISEIARQTDNSLYHCLCSSLYFKSKIIRKYKYIISNFYYSRGAYKKHSSLFLDPHDVDFNSSTLQLSEIEKYQLPKLLKYADSTSMGNSVESRVPYLDHLFVEYCLSLDLDEKINKYWTKYPLRLLLSKNGFDEIAWRRNKLGLAAPKGRKNSDRHMQLQTILDSKIVNEIINKRKINKNLPEPMLWKLFILSKWESLFIT